MEKLECKRCGYRWWPRVPGKDPLKCARCSSFIWKKPKKEKKGEKDRGG